MFLITTLNLMPRFYQRLKRVFYMGAALL